MLCTNQIKVGKIQIVHGLHWSMTKLSRFRPDLGPTCDKCQQASATLLHMFWVCSVHHQFWQVIFSTLSKVLGEPFEPCPFVGLVGTVPQGRHLNTNKVENDSLLYSVSQETGAVALERLLTPFMFTLDHRGYAVF